MDNIGIGIEGNEKKIEDMVDFFHKSLAKHVSKIGFGVDMAKVAKEKVCSNYFVIFLYNHEIVNQDYASYQFDEATIVFLELHNKIALVLDLFHYPHM